jgi:inosine/xanthosine triphosphate pyrophosphatase family protein
MHYVLVTTNSHKAEEFVRSFELYGKRVEVVSAAPESLSASAFETLARKDGVIAVFAEESRLSASSDGSSALTTPRDMQVVYHCSRLTVRSLEFTGTIRETEYRASVRGFIDLDLKKEGDDVFGWDDVFVGTSTNADFHTLKLMGMKNSARQIAISRFIVDSLTYESRLDLNFNRQAMAESVEFDGLAAQFVMENGLIQSGIGGSFLKNMADKVIDSGIFFRSSSNRREKNYWLPGLNAGIPLTAKKDEVHEATFFFHDLMHFQIPDLVYDGAKDDNDQRDAYIYYRMMSEAFTLVLADMYFIDGLTRVGIEYDFSKRKIYPLFQLLKLDGMDPVRALKAVLRASSLFAVNGDDSGFRALLDGSPEGEDALIAFKEKYGRFFTEDLVWTRRNFDTMSAQSDYVQRWIELVGRQTIQDNGLTMLGGFTKRVKWDYGKISVEAVFEDMFDTIIAPNLAYSRKHALDRTISNAFKRYMIGQMSIFARYGDICPLPSLGDKLLRKLKATDLLTSNDIAAMRGLYASYVDELRSRNLISDDDSRVYRSIHPLFPPNYVFYDAKKLDRS